MSETNFVTDMELAARGFDYGSQRAARNSGKLKFTPTEGGFLYSSADIASWLESTAGTFRGKAFVQSPPAAQTAPASGQVPRPINGARQTAAAGKPSWSAAAGGAKGQWQAAVARHTDGGMSRADAVQAVDASHPGLRERMLREVNGR